MISLRKLLLLFPLLFPAALLAQVVNPSGGGAPVTCANANNYPCLNTANAFTAAQSISSGATNVALSIATSSTINTALKFTNTSLAGGSQDSYIFMIGSTGGSRAGAVCGLAADGGTPNCITSAVDYFSSATALSWVATTDPTTGTADTGLSRIAAGVLGVGSGATGNVTGKIVAAGLGSGNASNTDLVGTLTMNNLATTVTYTFAKTYTSAPVCVVQPQGATPAASQALSGYVPTVSTTVLTITVGTTPATSVVFGYQCISRN